MLLNIDTRSKHVEKRPAKRLNDFGFNELDLQRVLFGSLDRLFPEEELLLVMQSRAWQEEPDLMALDRDGNLFIFELKAWESDSSNLLQVLRYGQIFGSFTLEDLDERYRNDPDMPALAEAHAEKFGVVLDPGAFNRKQVFVTITNGLDYRTREAVQYWRSASLDVRPWIYRVYAGDGNDMMLELAPFRVHDNPYEDLAEGYYIHNTNFNNDPADHDNMLAEQKVASYFAPWKFKVERLAKGDYVFLYQSGVGIVAIGVADGRLRKSAYQGDAKYASEEYAMKLDLFQRVSPPMSAAEIKKIAETDYRFLQTQFAISAEAGSKIRRVLHETNRLQSIP